MNAGLIRAQIEGMSPHRLGYLAGLLSVSLGLKRTFHALNALNAIPNVASDQNEYFMNMICILGIEVSQTDWDRAVEVLQRVMRKEESDVDQEKTSK